MSSNVFPVVGSYRISSSYGKRNTPTAGASSDHKGLDIAAASGSSVVSAAAGTVIYTGYNNTRGNYIKVDNGNGVTTLYQHLKSIDVNNGTTVKAGQKIGTVGSTGVSTGSHLHFEVLINDKNVNPETWLKNTENATSEQNISIDNITDTIKDNWFLIAACLLIIGIIKR